MAFSFAVTDSDGNGAVDMADFGLIVQDHELPLEPEPLTEVVNIPSKVGGWDYVNFAQPATLTLDVIVSADNNADLHANLESIADALPPLETLRVYVDGVARYWLGRRASAIQTGLYTAGLRTASFSITFNCIDPTAYDAPQGT